MVYATYEPGVDIEALGDTEILAQVVNPYFNRGEYQFCSHRQTPPTCEVSDSPAITRNGSVVYIANPVFTDYAINHCMVYRDIVEDLIGKLGVEPQVRAEVPSYVEITTRTLNQYLVIHILNYIIEHKSRTIDTIEEIAPLYHRHLSVRLAARPVHIYEYDADQQAERSLDFTWDGYRATIELPEIHGHTMVIVEQS